VGEEYISLSFWLWSFLHCPVTSSLLGPKESTTTTTTTTTYKIYYTLVIVLGQRECKRWMTFELLFV
jgi:hypothetical protein